MWQGWVAVSVLLSPPHAHGHRFRVGTTAATPKINLSQELERTHAANQPHDPKCP